MRTANKHLKRAAYRKRRKLGQCVRCGKTAELSMCQLCRQARAAYLRKRYREMTNALKASRGP